MNQNVQKFIIQRFVSVFGLPKTERMEDYYREWHKALKGFTAEALEHGADVMVRQHKFQRWPTIGEVYEACGTYTPPHKPEAPKAPAEVYPPPSEEAKARVRALAAEFRKSVQAMTINDKPRRKLPVPDRTFFEQRRKVGGE